MGIREYQRSFVGGELSPVMHSRPDDLRFQHGAAKLQNFTLTPQGSAKKRPGTRHIRPAKDTTRRSRVFPFRFSQDDSLVLELSTASVDSREIGHARMHKDGGTVLFQLPDTYVPVNGITAVTITPTNTFTTASPHLLSTGDEVVLSIHPTGEVVTSFTVADPGVVVHTFGLVPEFARVMFEGQGGGTLPAELEPRRIYYVRNPTPTDFELSETQNGPILEFTTAGAGTRWMATVPIGSIFLDVGTTYYVIEDTATTFKIALTKDLADAGTFQVIGSAGTADAHNDLRVHRDYQVGDLVSDLGTSYYCLRRPADLAHWLPHVTEDSHVGYADTDTRFFVRLPGSWNDNDLGTLAFTDATDRITWTGHALAAGTEIIFSEDGGTLPPNLTPNTVVYYLVNPDTNDFQVSLSPGGPVVDLGGNGAGTTLEAIAGSVFEVPHFFTEPDLLEVNFAQSLDVITLVHPTRPPLELRRMGPTSWESREVEFMGIAAPANVTVTPKFGFGIEVASVSAATPAVITTVENHKLSTATFFVPAFLQDVGGIPDGLYQLLHVTATTFDVHTLEDRDEVPGDATPLGPNPTVFPAEGGQAENATQTYVMTALDAVGNESPRSPEVEVTNFILAQGASNTITWDAVPGATRYRIYKKQDGILAFVGAVEATEDRTFKDDDIGPDGSLTAPIKDDSLGKTARITFDGTNHRVICPGHNTPEGQPIVFRSTGTMPASVVSYLTLYVLNPREDNFQLSATPGGISLVLSGADTEEFHEATFGNFPASVAYFEQRRVFAGGLNARRTMLMTRTGTESDMGFRIPTVASDRISAPVAARLGDAIRHVMPLTHLMILSNATEYRVTPINDDAITPDSISVRPMSFVGTNKATPEVVSNVGIAAAARGGHVRELGFERQFASFLAGDLSIRTPHLFDAYEIEQIAYSKAPVPILWFASSAGFAPTLTYAPEEQIAAWSHTVTDGTIESVAAIPEGVEDRVYLSVNRSGARHIERVEAADFGGVLADAKYLDDAVVYSGPATTSIWAPHLEGETVAALADGLVVTGLTVTAGFATLPVAATKVVLGLPYTARIEGLPLYVAIPGLGADRQKNVNSVRVRVVESGAFSMGQLVAPTLVPSKEPAAGALLTGTVDVTVPGAWSADAQVVLDQSDPLPLTVSSFAYDVAIGGGR